jgi:phosphate starvation-inducible protein PhoH
VRSIAPTRDIGFLPGKIEEKIAVYETPYRDMCYNLLGRFAYEDMKKDGTIEFIPTSFVRGLSWDNAIIIVDEIQNMTWGEIDSVVTRVGVNSRIILCGDDLYQNDIGHNSGINKALTVVKSMNAFGTTHFTTEDIVRSEFIKSWIKAREELRAG